MVILSLDGQNCLNEGLSIYTGEIWLHPSEDEKSGCPPPPTTHLKIGEIWVPPDT